MCTVVGHNYGPIHWTLAGSGIVRNFNGVEKYLGPKQHFGDLLVPIDTADGDKALQPVGTRAKRV